MAYIREKTEERTGFQTGSEYIPSVDNQCDFVMVYRYNDSFHDRVKMYRDKGYVIHFMTGISWGDYVDYLYGEWDGRNHWDEAQTDRFGNQILHGKDVPYIVPTVSFADYITEQLKLVVDEGVEAIHVEEPEFWDRAGYSPAFQREYALYYHEPWTPPHESLDARYRCAKLKQYLFTRTIDRVSAALKEYAMVKYGRKLRFYVPTHSLLNYTQWKIISPEGQLADIPGVDGCIAQVWTGTSREKNWFNGELKERTFETAFLEYGVMQELVKGTGRHMWFLHDPIEDNPIFDWTDYRKNYLCTVAASLMHPVVNTYEISPWPHRIFENLYPKGTPDAQPIPDDYRTVLNNMYNTLGTLEAQKQEGVRIGILMGDCQLYQREYPDCCFSEAASEEVGTVLRDSDELTAQFKKELFNTDNPDRELLLKFQSGNAFPGFYGLALPLLKYGIPVRPVLLDNARRYNGYLDDYDVLIMSYEYMKPDYPDINTALAAWVRRGGTLLYVGDGSDPYHNIRSWWTGSYQNCAEHLFESLEISPKKEKEIFACGKGKVGVYRINPGVFGCSAANADLFRAFVKEVTGIGSYKNNLVTHRDPYIVAAVMDESVDDSPLTFTGSFADMFRADFALLKSKILLPGEQTMLFDLNKIQNETLAVIGTSARIFTMREEDNGITVQAYGADKLNAAMRLKVPAPITAATANNAPCAFDYDKETGTVLVRFCSEAKPVTLRLCY